jgi:hypothetical protein
MPEERTGEHGAHARQGYLKPNGSVVPRQAQAAQSLPLHRAARDISIRTLDPVSPRRSNSNHGRLALESPHFLHDEPGTNPNNVPLSVSEEPMEAQDNMQLGLQKAISSHEQAASALNDLIGVLSKDRYQAMIGRIDENIRELKEDSAKSKPGDHV